MSCPTWRDTVPERRSWPMWRVLGLTPLHISGAGEAKHIFSHVEWRMKGYFIKVASTEEKKIGELIFAE